MTVSLRTPFFVVGTRYLTHPVGLVHYKCARYMAAHCTPRYAFVAAEKKTEMCSTSVLLLVVVFTLDLLVWPWEDWCALCRHWTFPALGFLGIRLCSH